MTKIADWLEAPVTVRPDASIDAIVLRFRDHPELEAVAVVDGERLVGIVERGVLDGAAGRLPTDRLPRHRVVDADAEAADVLAGLMAAPFDGARTAAVMRAGRCVGLLTPRAIMAALHRRLGCEQRLAEERRGFIELLNHEVRTPMNGVMAVADLLRRQHLAPDAQAYVQTIIDTSETLLSRLRDALDLALADVGQLVIEPSSVLIRDLVDGLQASPSTPPLLVSYDGDPELTIHADGQRLRQALDFVIRALRRTAVKGLVEVSLRTRVGEAGVHLTAKVRSGGPAMPPDQMARLFEPSLHSDHIARTGWTGFGLPLARRIVEAMGGAIRAESNVGDGVAVTFEVVAPQVAEQGAAPAPSPSAGAKAHILVVDDNATNRMVAEGLCEMFEFTCECVEDGLQAVEAAQSGRFDLVLMDIKMPRMDGVEATRQIRALPGEVGRTPIIALTANADPEDARAYVSAGMLCVVEKPIKPDKLIAAILTALNAGSGRSRAA